MRSRLARYLAVYGIRTVLVLGIAVFGYLLVQRVHARWDLTEDDRFTISDASRRIARELKDPLVIRAYFNDELPPRYQPLQRQVFDILQEYEASSAGKIKVERFDPLENRKIESEASSYGIQPARLPLVEATSVQELYVYGGIVLLYGDRASEVIDVASRYREGLDGLSGLEYAITSSIWTLSHDRPVLGIAGSLTSAPSGNPFQQSAPRNEFTRFRKFLGDSFDIRDVDLDDKAPDPAEIPLLVLIRPREMTDAAVFRLDQYLMRGGRVLMFVTQGEISSSPFGGGLSYTPFSTGLDDWLRHYGLRIPNEFVCHWQSAETDFVTVRVQGLQAQQAVPSWFWPVVGAQAMSDDNPAVQGLQQVSFFWPHPVEVIQRTDGPDKNVLVRSHESESWRWKNLHAITMSQIDPRTDAPSAGDLGSWPLVVSVEGGLKSYFSEKPVPASLVEEDAETGPEIVKEGAETSRLVVVGNAFFLSDLLSARNDDVARHAVLLGLNLADWLGRSADLIDLRGKRFTSRPLHEDATEQMRSLAEKYNAGELSESEVVERISELQDDIKRKQERWRWANVLFPPAFVLVAGLLVWILRAAFRARGAKLPQPHTPRTMEG